MAVNSGFIVVLNGWWMVVTDGPAASKSGSTTVLPGDGWPCLTMNKTELNNKSVGIWHEQSRPDQSPLDLPSVANQPRTCHNDQSCGWHLHYCDPTNLPCHMSPATLLPISSSLMVNHKMEFTISKFGHSKVKRQVFQTEVVPRLPEIFRAPHLVTPIGGISIGKPRWKWVNKYSFTMVNHKPS